MNKTITWLLTCPGCGFSASGGSGIATIKLSVYLEGRRVGMLTKSFVPPPYVDPRHLTVICSWCGHTRKLEECTLE